MVELKQYEFAVFEEMSWTIAGQSIRWKDIVTLRYLNKHTLNLNQQEIALTDADRKEVENILALEFILDYFRDAPEYRAPKVYWCGDRGFCLASDKHRRFLPDDVIGFAQALHANNIPLEDDYLGSKMPIDKYIHQSEDPNLIILLADPYYGKTVEVDALIHKIKEIDPKANPVYDAQRGEIYGYYQGVNSKLYKYKLRICTFLICGAAGARTAIDNALSQVVK